MIKSDSHNEGLFFPAIRQGALMNTSADFYQHISYVLKNNNEILGITELPGTQGIIKHIETTTHLILSAFAQNVVALQVT